MCGCMEELQQGLQYSTPALGGWGSMRTCMLVPESHILYAIPFACGRHGSIAAYIHGVKDRLSYLYLKEEDIVSGNYENLMIEAVDEVLAILPKQPKAFIIFVSCIDDLLGTDHEAILQTLREKYEDVRFAFCHMNPIAKGGKFPPGVTLQKGMFSLLERPSEERKNIVNLIGNQVKPAEECELYPILAAMGIDRVAHISDYALFDEWQEMAQSRLNLMLLKTAREAAKDMEQRFNIPTLTMNACYDPDIIRDRYQLIADALGEKLPAVVEDYYAEAVEKLKKTAEYFSGVEIIVSHSCTTHPFGLARVLKKYGFDVREVMTAELDADTVNREAFRKEYPEIKVVLSTHHSTVLREQSDEKILALGMQAGYLTGSRNVVVLAKDEGLFGFYGIKMFMDMMIEAWEQEIDLEEKIKESGLVI